MKKLFTVLLTLLAVSGVWGQITNESFESGDFPAGWTQNSSYVNTGSAYDGSYKMGMNATADWVQTNLRSNPGTLSFWVRTSSDPDNWILTVQTSPDGSSYTDRLTVTEDGAGGDVTDTYAEFSVVLNLSGNYYIRWYITSRSSGSIYVDYINLTLYSPGGVDNPTDFTATASSTSQIDLSWTKNGSGDDVMIAFNTVDTFGDPSGSYSVADPITGGGTVIYNSNGTSYNHTGLTDNTTYYYKAWSVDGTTTYSSGVSTSATTIKEEPTNHVTDFSAVQGSPAHSSVDLTWTDAAGGTVPDGYLIKGSDVGYGSITDPVDGTAEPDGGLVLNIAQGTGTATFSGLDSETTYYFNIYPYTNSGTDIDYKIDGTVPSDDVTTGVLPALVINEILADPDATNGDANGDGIISTADDEFVELINNSESSLDISGWKLYDGFGLRHIFPGSTVIPANESIVVFAGGTPTNIPGISQVASESSGLGLNNTGDDVIIKNSSDVTIVSYTYSSEGGDNQSLARDPDITGNFVKHTTIVSNSVYQSPGRDNTDNSALPVELSSFTAYAAASQVNLSWATATEVNNYGFEIERFKVKGERYKVNKGWEKIGFVEGAGNSNSPVEYNYIDKSVADAGTYFYRLKQVDLDGAFEYSDEIEVTFAAPNKYQLDQNYPNPFNPVTSIKFSIPQSGLVSLKVFNTLGEEVANLLNNELEAGYHTVEFDASMLSSGIYFYRLSSNDFVAIKKMLLIK